MPGQSKSGHSSTNTAKPADPSMDSTETTPFTKGKRKKRDWITPGTVQSQLYPGEQPAFKKQKTSSLSTPNTGAKILSVAPGKITQPKEQKKLPEENQSGQLESQSTHHRATKRKRTNTEAIYISDDEGTSSVKRPRVTQNRSSRRKITNKKKDVGRPRQLKPFAEYHRVTFGAPPPTFDPLYMYLAAYEKKDAEFANIFDEEHSPSFRAPTPPAMSNPAIKPATAFHLFCKLPLELRMTIWEIAMEPRVVPLFAIIGGMRNTSNVPGREGSLRIITTAPVPAVLHVHRESREFAQKRYKLAFGLGRDPKNGQIYFDFKRDILYIHSGDTRILAPRFSRWCCKEERMQFQRLAIQAPIKAHDDTDPLGPYPALRTLDIVLRNFHDPIPNIREAFEKPITHAEMADLALLPPLFDDATDATRSTMRHGDTAVKRYRQRFEFCGEQDRLGDDRSLDECLQYLGPFQRLPPDNRESLYPKKEDVTIGIKVIGRYSTRRAVLKMAEGSDQEQFAGVVDENGRKLKKDISEDEAEGLPVADATKNEEATL